jgi:hypothetical protein
MTPGGCFEPSVRRVRLTLHSRSFLHHEFRREECAQAYGCFKVYRKFIVGTQSSLGNLGRSEVDLPLNSGVIDKHVKPRKTVVA